MNQTTVEKIKRDIESTRGSSTEWIHERRTEHLKEKNDFEKDSNRRGGGVLRVPRREQAVLWIEEIAGQISDGAYENDRRLSNDGWVKFSRADVVVDDSLEKPVFESSEPVETLVFSRDLTENDGLVGRMLFQVKVAVNQDYNIYDLKRDLEELEQATREA